MPFRQVATPSLIPGHTLRIVGLDPRISPNPFAGGPLYYFALTRTNGEVIYLAARVNIEFAYVPVQASPEGEAAPPEPRLEPRVGRERQ